MTWANCAVCGQPYGGNSPGAAQVSSTGVSAAPVEEMRWTVIVAGGWAPGAAVSVTCCPPAWSGASRNVPCAGLTVTSADELDAVQVIACGACVSFCAPTVAWALPPGDRLTVALGCVYGMAGSAPA